MEESNEQLTSEMLFELLKANRQELIENRKKTDESLRANDQLQRQISKLAHREKQDAKRGRPPSPAREICNSMLTYCETIIGDNNDLFIEVSRSKGPEFSGRYSLTEILPGQKRFDDVLTIMYTEETGEQPLPDHVKTGIEMYLQRTRPRARTLPVARRVGHIREDDELVIYVDRGAKLASKRFIRIDKQGVTLVNSCEDAVFISESGIRELPEPQLDGTFAVLEQHGVLGVSEEELRVLFMYQLQLLLMKRSYVNVFFRGPTRSGKSTRAAYTQQVLQPHENFFISEAMPDNSEDILLRGSNTLSICYDNISRIDKDQSDNFCRMSMGAALKKRMLYTNGTLYGIEAKNPLIFTSVYHVIQYRDLLSRTLVVPVSPRAVDVGDDPQKLEDDFRRLHPLWLGALCNAASGALRNIDEVRSTRLGDLAAFERWMIAAGIELTQNGILKWNEDEIGNILEVYTSDRRGLSPVLRLVEILLTEYTEGRLEYEESASRLLMDLATIAEALKIETILPGHPEHLSRLLNNSRYELFEHDIWVKTGMHTKYGNRVALRLMLTPEEVRERNFAAFKYHTGVG